MLAKPYLSITTFTEYFPYFVYTLDVCYMGKATEVLLAQSRCTFENVFTIAIV
jgi:hypothetical protein